MRVKRSVKRRKQRGNPFLFFLSCLFFIVSASALLAMGWQALMPGVVSEEMPQIDESLKTAPIKFIENDGDISVEPPEPISLPAPTTDSGKSMDDRVRNEYFNDAAFVGDSITTGIEIYDVMSNADVFAVTGLGLYNILDKQCISMGEEMVTIPEALMRTKPKKIYIMLGGNSLGGYDESAYNAYKLFIETIAQQNSESIIYIQSVLPVNEQKFREKYKKELTNKRIDEFNGQLKTFSEQNGYCYLDIASVFKNESGEMPAEFTPDGIHIRSEQYIMWFDYLKENAIE